MPSNRLRAFALGFICTAALGLPAASADARDSHDVAGGLVADNLAGVLVASSLAHARATTDQPDDESGPQIHLVYALPSDGVDRALDVNGTIDGSIASAQAWLASQADGRTLRLDTLAGTPDISFVRMPQTRAAVAAQGDFVRDLVESDLATAGFTAPDKIYLVWYDGLSTSSCGAGPLPPTVPGNTTVLYLQGEPAGFSPCVGNAFATAGAPPGYWEFVAVHEAVHALGFVPACAPHATANGHVSEPPNDLMYAGDQPWDIAHMVLDAGHDDYFDHGQAGCPDLADSPFLDGGPASPGIPAPPVAPLPVPLLPTVPSVPIPLSPPQVLPRKRLAPLTGIARIQRGVALAGSITLTAPADAVTVEAFVRARLLEPHAPASPVRTRIGAHTMRGTAGRRAFRLPLTRGLRAKLAVHKSVTITLRITVRAGDVVVVQSKQVTWKAPLPKLG